MDLNNTLPKQIMFSLRDLQNIGFLKISTAKKIIAAGDMEAVRVGVKLFILRDEVIRYFNDNIVNVSA